MPGWPRRIGQEQDLDADSVDYILDQVGLSPREPEVASDPGSFGAAMSLIRAHVESVLGELKAPFSYAARQYPGAAADGVLLAGCGASIPGLSEHAHSRLNVKVRPVAPRDVVACPPALADKGGDPSWTVAVGLAQHPD